MPVLSRTDRTLMVSIIQAAEARAQLHVLDHDTGSVSDHVRRAVSFGHVLARQRLLGLGFSDRQIDEAFEHHRERQATAARFGTRHGRWVLTR